MTKSEPMDLYTEKGSIKKKEVCKGRLIYRAMMIQ